MVFLDRLLQLFAPYHCLGCQREGQLLCSVCALALDSSSPRCYSCQKPSAGSLTCSHCATTTSPRAVLAATSYQGNAKDLLWLLKSRGTRQAVVPMVRLMLPLLNRTHAYVVVPVPTATTRVRQRGYDQAAVLARELAYRAQLPRYPLLARIGQAHQVGANRGQRQAQIQGAFRVRNPQRARGATVLLVDDVLTTGATLEAAATVLYAAGAKRVDAITFARA